MNENLEAALYLQAAIFRKGYDDFSFLRPVGQDLGGFQKLEGGDRFPGGKDYPAPLHPEAYAL
jgi:hypothetical protein